MNFRNLVRLLLSFDILLALISGPILSTLLMLLPLGVLIGLFEVLDPAFVAYEYVPEEILFIPWIAVMLFVSLVNLRTTFLLKSHERNPSTYIIETDIFYIPPRDRLDQDEFPGKCICDNFKSYISEDLPEISCSQTIHKDYGWCFVVENDINSLIEVSFSFAGLNELDPHIEKYEVSIDYSPPFNPVYRISFFPNALLYNNIHDMLSSFMSRKGIELIKE